MAGACPGIARDPRATVVPGAFSTQECRALRPTGASDTGLSVRPAWRPCVREGSAVSRVGAPGNGCCGGARAKGLKAGVAGSARRSRCSRIFDARDHFHRAAAVMSQVSMSLLNTRFKRCAHSLPRT